jgi:predicted glycoside hydrolase/deacetylase ChbG (UPF0249 family)
MVRYPAAAQAAHAARALPGRGLGLGLHLDLGEWEYRDGEWRSVYDVADTDDRDAVEAELARQLAEFERLAGGPPTHIDSHQHVHRDEPVRAAVRRAGERLGVPVRHFAPVRYCGAFYGQGRNGESLPSLICADALAALVAALADGGTELACHPADGVDFESSYGPERVQELRALCDARVAAAVRSRGVELCSFAELRQS